ncbi:structural protein P5 [Stenotrophomonas maltophilia]|uniref:structural protein P5 n=1 Tax=Stenotrophomonas maltophilia TaxID=40324 RepID=UPI002B1D2ECA|nr:structural protein P5 [Stenotrophomonas maltophilia]
MAARQPRGVRNNNPGNIDRTDVVWQGEDRSFAARDAEPRFCVFKSADFGFRALARVLRTYRERYGLTTVRGIIGRWAPPNENNTDAYVQQVAKAIGVKPDDAIDVRRMTHCLPLAKAIAKHENGGDYWTEATIRAGLLLAGVNE